MLARLAGLWVAIVRTLSAELAATIVVAEVVVRLTSAAALVAHFHLFGTHRGTPGGSVGETAALYRGAVAFLSAYLDMPALVYVGHYLPEIGSLPSGGPNMNHVLREVSQVQFFDGIGFAIVVGYVVALAVAYAGVRGVSRLVLGRVATTVWATVQP